MKITFKQSPKTFVVVGTVKEAKQWFDPAYCLKAVESDGDALAYVNITKTFLKVSA